MSQQTADLASQSKALRTYGHWIGGVPYRSSDKQIERRSPATGELVATFADGTADDVEAAVAAARQAFDLGPWPRMAGVERAAVLRAFADGIRDARDTLVRIEVEEVGKPVNLAHIDVDAAIDQVQHAAALAHDIHGEAYTDLGPDCVGLITREPVGVAVVITPWNFPLGTYAEKVSYALAAGCTVVVKPSEFTSGSSIELTRIAREAGVPDGVVNVVTGLGSVVGQALVESSGVDIISFTGSTATGRRVTETAAADMKLLSLELGGKGATVVFADADLDDALDGAVFAAFFTAGECCIAGSRLLVEESIADEFMERVAARARSLRVGLPTDDLVEVGALIHEQHAEKVLGYFESATAEGAELLAGGHRVGGALASGAFVEPTVFDGVRPDMKVFQEEIFGPVICATRFSTMQEAIELTNQTSYGLGNSVWTKNIDTAMTMTRAIRSGMVWVNTTIDLPPQMPYGGTKGSGYGRETGSAGIETYSQKKTTVMRLGKREPFYPEPPKGDH